MNHDATSPSPTLFGHPTGLFTLFFAEMWERFSYYGMRALLVFYLIKGFLGYGDKDAYAVYGAYTALVYMTPFFGGLLADRLLGARRAVILGGLLMAGGQLLLTVENTYAFFTGLALLICGNGFFKPNISTIVGSLYPQGSSKRDGGFTIFYMGINLGAAMSPLLCGYVGETFGWHWGFGLASLGMLVGLAVFVAPRIVTQALILVGAASAATALIRFKPDNPFSIGVNIVVAVSLVAAAVMALFALGAGGLSKDAGAPRDPQRLRRRVWGPITAEWAVYLGTAVTIPVFVLLVSGFAPLTEQQRGITVIPESFVQDLQASQNPWVQVAATVVTEASRPAGLVLMLAGVLAFAYLGIETFRLDTIPRQRMYVVLILTFFSMLFWAFFEQAGSSVNNFTDRNVDRVFEDRTVTAADVGQTIRLQPTQEQLGYANGSQLFTLDVLDKLRQQHGQKLDFEIDWQVTEGNVGMGLARRVREIPASTFQAVNPIYILVFGLAFTALWAVLAKLRLEPSTPVKFALGLLQLGLGFGAFWYGAQSADGRGMVGLWVLFAGYLLHTTGELCLSPVGLSMVTRLSPAHLVSTVMGAWFLATAFSQFLAAIIAQFTGVGHGEGSGQGGIPVPTETVHVYGDVFGKIAIAAVISAAICFLLAPILKRWMHEDAAAAS
ncbi:MAG: peptide MFS transporter [Candidatus Anammoximicrobium sp.]|nr:peptide MFS transporter [Candidatus Anammoximicrobium sp.]